jgi:hypothetical protein
MAKMSGQVCLTHPDRAAVSRCETCFKPLCEECIQHEGGKHFCSSTCVENFAQSEERIDTLDARNKAARRKKLIRRLVYLIILAAIAYFAYRWLQSNPDKSEQLKQRFKNAAEEVKQKVE